MSNVYIGEGLLTRFEARNTPTGKTVYQFSILLPEKQKPDAQQQKKEGTFIPVEAWDDVISPQLAQLLTGQVKKCRAFVKGRLKLDYWTDNSTGANRTALKVIADVVSYLPLQRKNQQQGGQGGQAAGGQAPATTTQGSAPAPAATPAPQPEVQYDTEGNPIPF